MIENLVEIVVCSVFSWEVFKCSDLIGGQVLGIRIGIFFVLVDFGILRVLLRL